MSALTGAAAVTFWLFIYVPHLSLVWLMLISGPLVFTGVESSRVAGAANPGVQRAGYEGTQTRPWPTSSALFI